MRKSYLIIAIICFLCSFSVVAEWVAPSNKNWHVKLDDAFKQAKSEDKMVLILNCGSDWNAQSKQLLKWMNGSSDLKKLIAENFVVLYIDSPWHVSMPKDQIKHNSMVQRKFKIINKIPCALVLEANGKVVEQIREFSSSKKYIAELTKICDGDDDEDSDAFDSDVPIDDEQPSKSETPKNKNKNWLPGPDDNWFVDYDLALAEAKKSGKNIYVLNTGSDWCGWCVKLRQDVLGRKKFKKLAEEHFVLLYLDNPRRKPMPADQKAHNDKVRRSLQFGGGVPSAVILDANGKKIGTIGGYMAEQAYISKLKKHCKNKK
ncbi:MAG: thioredoxin family protein [Lentisphaeria bacterium]|nr:thioredoxin family protein [Lentisphaeria bacterium]